MDTLPTPSLPGATLRRALALPEADDREANVLMQGGLDDQNLSAARVLVEHLFAKGRMPISGIEYSAAYRLAYGMTGGDIVDVYHFDNDSVAFSIADISGKGSSAAVHAAMIKYGLRAYASQGLTPECVLRALDRLYLENNAFEHVDSFASVFFGVIDSSRRMMHYASGGHEPALILVPGEQTRVLVPTAPLLGVFDDKHSLFKHIYVNVPPGTLFVATTDGVTEARNAAGEFFGMEGFIRVVEEFAAAPTGVLVDVLIDNVRAFSNDSLHDDIAVIAARFP